MRLLIDGEYYLYRYAISHQENYEWDTDIISTRVRVGEAVARLAEDISALVAWAERGRGAHGSSPQVGLCFGDRSRSFRHSVYREYKSNRKNNKKPVGYEEMLARLSKLYTPFPTLDLLEGDDVIGVLSQPGDIVIGVDKDFQTLPLRRLKWQPWSPGWRLDLAVEEGQEQEANRQVFRQALAGDAADGYPGCPGIGNSRAANLLRDASTEREMWDTTRGAFAKAGLDEAFALQMVQCARILRSGEYDHERRMPILWQPPLR